MFSSSVYQDLKSEEPLLQFGNDIFKGKYSHSMGTNLILEEASNTTSELSSLYPLVLSVEK